MHLFFLNHLVANKKVKKSGKILYIIYVTDNDNVIYDK